MGGNDVLQGTQKMQEWKMQERQRKESRKKRKVGPKIPTT